MIEERVGRIAGSVVRSLRPIEGGGYAASYRAVAELVDGRSVFVKAGAEEVTSAFLRDEQRVYAALQGPFMAELIGMDEEEPPLLVLEDLSGERWPPPWDEASVDAVRRTLEAVAATPPPDWLPPITDEAEFLTGWAEIEREPGPFLSLGVCTAAWLEASLPTLRAAAESAQLAGDSLLHLDVRSDNIALTRRGAVLVDWNWAHVGNPALDVAFWLPSLADEGGPRPEAVLPGSGKLAATVAGFFGSRAGLPAPPTAPQVRTVQLSQLRVALPWAARELDLPPVG